MTIANNGTLRLHVKIDRPYCNPMIKNPTYPTVTPWGIVEMTMQERMTGMINRIRELIPTRFAEEILSVQPMDSNLMIDVMKEAKNEEWLIENGYEPVDPQTRLLWRKRT
jgi:hypothetical protein